MYQSPDFVKVKINVDDVYSGYDPKCNTRVYSGYMLVSGTCKENDQQFYNSFVWTNDTEKDRYGFSNCWESPSAE